MFYQVINTLSDNLKRKYKYLEKNKCKIITKKWSVEYNKIILKEKILPNYIKVLTCKKLCFSQWNSWILFNLITFKNFCSWFGKKLTTLEWIQCYLNEKKCSTLLPCYLGKLVLKFNSVECCIIIFKTKKSSAIIGWTWLKFLNFISAKY